MENRLIRTLQICQSSLINSDGYWLDEPVGELLKLHTSKENAKAIIVILSIINASDKIAFETKLYLRFRGINIKECNRLYNQYVEEYNNTATERLRGRSYITSTHLIAYDNNALDAILGINTILDLMYNRVQSSLEIEHKIDKLRKEYGVSNNLRNNVGLFINPDEISSIKKISNDEFIQGLEKIRPYLVCSRAKVEREINSNLDFVRYFNYLLCSDSITNEKAIRDRLMLLNFLETGELILNTQEEIQYNEEEPALDNIEEQTEEISEVETTDKTRETETANTEEIKESAPATKLEQPDEVIDTYIDMSEPEDDYTSEHIAEEQQQSYESQEASLTEDSEIESDDDYIESDDDYTESDDDYSIDKNKQDILNRFSLAGNSE